MDLAATEQKTQPGFSGCVSLPTIHLTLSILIVDYRAVKNRSKSYRCPMCYHFRTYCRSGCCHCFFWYVSSSWKNLNRFPAYRPDFPLNLNQLVNRNVCYGFAEWFRSSCLTSFRCQYYSGRPNRNDRYGLAEWFRSSCLTSFRCQHYSDRPNWNFPYVFGYRCPTCCLKYQCRFPVRSCRFPVHLCQSPVHSCRFPVRSSAGRRNWNRMSFALASEWCSGPRSLLLPLLLFSSLCLVTFGSIINTLSLLNLTCIHFNKSSKNIRE
jgi:hypothetical protein